MNFFGHAAVAVWFRGDAGFVLGAMLPDLLGMAKVRGARAREPAISRGVSMHQHTDEVFHGTPAFLRLCAEARERLDALGVARASARAIAHVGTELLLDGLLVEQPETRSAYERAIAARDLDAEIAFGDDAARARFLLLRDRLQTWGVPEGYRDPTFVGDRLVQVLSSRPRLALGPGQEGASRAWLPEGREAVARSRDALLSQVREALYAHPARALWEAPHPRFG